MAGFRRKMVDIGANLTDPMFKGIYNGSAKHAPDLNAVLTRSERVGVEKIIVTSGCIRDAEEALSLVKSNSSLYTTVGCHPTRCLEFVDSELKDEQYISRLVALAKENPSHVVAVGEFGLDYDRIQFCPKDVQLKYFEKQLEIAEQTKLPLFLHCRNAADDLIKILAKNRESFSKGVVHSFDGTLEEANRILNLGLLIGINGCSLKTEENLTVVSQLPQDRLLIETDSPWCEIKPSHASFKYVKTKFQTKKKEKHEKEYPVKGRNEPASLVQILEVLTAVMDSNIEDLAECFYKNSLELFFK